MQCGLREKLRTGVETTCKRNEIVVEKGRMEDDKIQKMIYLTK